MLRLLTLFLAVLISQNSEAKSPPPGTGFQDVPTNVLLMLDTSGSMNSDIFSGDTKYPYDLDFDSAGNIYVAKYFDSIERYNSDGEYMLDWGGNDGGTPTDGKFNNVYSIAIDSSNLVYVADANNGRIQIFNQLGTFQSKFSISTSTIKGIEIDSADNVYALNANGKVEKYTKTGTLLATWTNTGGEMLAIDSSNNVYVTNYNAKKVEKYNSSGVLQSSINVSTYNPFGIEVDASGNIYVSSPVRDKIYKYNAAGTLLTTYGGTGGGAGKFREPKGIAKDGSGNIWVADYRNYRIQSPDGTLLYSNASHETRLDQAKRVIKDLVSNSDLTDGANFGLLEWNHTASIAVPISDSGAAEIYSYMDTIGAGGLTSLDAAMEKAQDYFLGPDTPVVDGAWCQNTIMIVISDGFWQDINASSIVESLYNNQNIKTFVVGFLVSSTSSGSENYIDVSQKGGTYPDSPVFADNWQRVYEAITQYILSVINSQLTFSAPTIMPGVTGEDSILQSTFKYKTDHQWKGFFKKYALNSNGTVGSLLWEAGSLLNEKAADSRQIWTVGTGIPEGINNFTTTNRDRLRVMMEENSGIVFTDNELDSLINFVRGKDSYNEFPGSVDDEGDSLLTGERWKLADIYHSRAVVVGAPNAFTSDEAGTNTEAKYRFDNGYNTFKTGGTCGTVCSERDEVIYVGSNGGMLHAFDSATGQEKWAFIPPSVIPNFKDMVSISSAKSESIYGVDGSPTVKDIYYGGAWHTVLISGLRQGGKSYFALDITNPDVPQHLFTFAHNTVTDIVSYWDSDGNRTDYPTSSTIDAQYDYSEVGEAWSDPIILRLPVGSSGAMKWTAVFGGGYNGAITADYAANLFIIDMEDGGKIINKVDIADTISGNGIQNSVPPQITAVTADSTTLFTDAGAVLYMTDLEGKLWKVNLSDQGTLYDTTKIFNSESTDTNGRLSFNQLATTVSTNHALMHFFGTGHMQKLEQISSSLANRGYGIIDSDFPSFSSASSMLTVSNLANISSGECPVSSQNGWYLDLDANEKITAKATVKNNIVLFPRYTPDSDDICSAGTAKISEHDATCGTTIRETDLGYGVPTGAVVYKNKIYIGISTDIENENLPDGFTQEGNLIVGDPASLATGNVNVESWWEEF